MIRIRTMLVVLVGLLVFPAVAQTPPTPEPGDSREIAFVATKVGETQIDIYLLNVDTGEMRNLTNSPKYELSVVWSPDGKYLAYTSFGGVHVMDLKTGETKQIVSDGETLFSWSSNENLIFFVSVHNGEESLSAVRGDGKKIIRFLKREETFGIAVSPDDKTVLIASENGIEALTLADRKVVALTETPGWGSTCDIVAAPAWSSDGERIMFACFQTDDGSYQLYIMNADGSGLRQLTHDWSLLPNTFQWWSDGASLIFATRDGNLEHTIYQMATNGETIQPLARVEFLPSFMELSPDTTKIAAVSMRMETLPDLYIINTDGSEVRRITDGEFELIDSLVWRPVPAAGE